MIYVDTVFPASFLYVPLINLPCLEWNALFLVGVTDFTVIESSKAACRKVATAAAATALEQEVVGGAGVPATGTPSGEARRYPPRRGRRSWKQRYENYT